MAYVVYLRKSRADAEAEIRGEGETLQRHEKALIEVAKKQKLNISKIYKEIVSGETIAARPVMQNLLVEVEQGLWDGVLVMEVERLARGDTIDQGIMAQTFKYSNTKIITPNKTYDPNNEFDEEYFEFGLFMSRREYKTINRRLQRGRVTSVKEGKYVGNKPPFGYLRKKLDKEKGYTLEPHPDQADVVGLIYELYTKGEAQEDGGFKRLGVSLIARKLNDLKIPAMRGIWVNSSIQTILRNPVYAGKIRWNSRPGIKKVVDGQVKMERPRAKKEDWVLSDGMHEPLISMETFEIANVFIDSNRPKPCPKNSAVKNPLSGLVKCGMCGRNMIRRPHNQRGYPDTIMCAVPACDNISTALSIVEEKVLQALLEWMNSYKVEQNIIDGPSVDVNVMKKVLVKLEADLEGYNNQIANIHDLLEQGVYTTDTFLERSKLLSEKISAAKNDMRVISAEIKNAEQQQKAKISIIPKVEEVLKIYHTMENAADKNELLKQVIEKVVYWKSEKGNQKRSSSNFKLILHPKIPQ